MHCYSLDFFIPSPTLFRFHACFLVSSDTPRTLIFVAFYSNSLARSDGICLQALNVAAFQEDLIYSEQEMCAHRSVTLDFVRYFLIMKNVPSKNLCLPILKKSGQLIYGLNLNCERL